MSRKTLTDPNFDDEDEALAAAAAPRTLSDDFYDDFLRGSKMDTIYESYEEFLDDSSDERSNETSSMVCSSEESSSARGSADSPTGVLRRSVRAWCDATGLPTAVLIEAKDRSFRLHKFPLVSRSAYFRRVFLETSTVTLPEDFPGGTDVFQMVANFCYDPKALRIDSSNVAALRCAADFLGMPELAQSTEHYMNKFVFRSWTDAILVLGRAHGLLPIAEDVLIVGRCIDGLASVACLEVEDAGCHHGNPEGGTFRPSLMKDLLELPSGAFARFVVSARRQGMEERHTSEVIMEYAKKWLLLDHGNQGNDDGNQQVALLETLVRLLPLERFVVPLGLLFCFHGRCIAWGASSDCREQLEARIASQLELATNEDVLMSVRSVRAEDELGRAAHTESMHHIVTVFMSQQQIILDGTEMVSESRNEPSYSLLAVSAVARVWDEYLTEVASDPNLGPRKFSDLSAAVPTHIRTSHDQLYRAINLYLKLHTTLSPTDRLIVCKALNCQKLSKEVCVHAVQNEHMPLRLIVQAMFMQQLQSRAMTSDGESSARVRSGRYEPPQDLGLGHRVGPQVAEKEDGMPLGLILQRDAAFREAAYLKDDFHSTKVRLRELEDELNRMKKNVEDVERKHAEAPAATSVPFSDSKRRKFVGSCIYQVWGSQANGIRLGQRITKTFHKLGFGGFWKRPSSDAGVRNNTKWSYENTPSTECMDPGELRASSFRRTEDDNKSVPRNTGRGFHTRHHSFS